MKEYIGLLDSGVGGLSVLKEVIKFLPDENYIYFGDTKNLPYGTKTPDEIYSYTKKILNFFVSKNVKVVAIACNTTSAVAYDRLYEEFKNKLVLFPLIQSSILGAVSDLEKGDTIAIMATRATVNSKKYTTEIKKILPKLNVIEIDCTGFVEIVENRLYDSEESLNLIKSKLEVVRESGARRVVLGCTHYPYLKNIFKQILDVDYFDPALYLAYLMKSLIVPDKNAEAEKLFYVSKNPDDFIKNAKIFFDIEKAELVELDEDAQKSQN